MPDFAIYSTPYHESRPEEFARVAYTFLGVPFVPNGRNPNVGLDCVGLISAALTVMGIEHKDVPYALVPHADLYAALTDCLSSVFYKVEGATEADWRVGDVFTIRQPEMRNHVGIYLGKDRVLHANLRRPMNKVVVTPMDYSVKHRVYEVWRFKETV